MKHAGQILSLLLAALLTSCTSSGPLNFLAKRSPHEQYGQKLINAGLKETSLGRMWFEASERAFNSALLIKVPYKETGYFPPDKARSTSLKFEVKRGEKISVSIQKRPANFNIFVDLWELKSNGKKKLLSFTDTSNADFSYEVDEEGTYLVRLQPELLASGEYTLTITSGPSLDFPVKNGKMGSFWGADRDGGIRRHEGVDIFAPKRTPALAVADGVISRVATNELGGKVIFLNPDKRNYSIYYAHLDEQLLPAGKKVKRGDTIALIGNTGNAAATSPHLHFGIYTAGGAIDPLSFISPNLKRIPVIKSSTQSIGKYLHTEENVNFVTADGESELPANSLAKVQAATDNLYKVLLPDGKIGFIKNTQLSSKPLKQIDIGTDVPLYDKPDTSAARITLIRKGTAARVLGRYKNFAFVRANKEDGWIEVK